MDCKINHLAIIMDGNARWAQNNNKMKLQGHKKGAEAAKALLPYLKESGIKYMTLYGFSSENWRRPKEEISSLFNLLSNYIVGEIDTLNKFDIKLKVIGDLTRLSEDLQKKIQTSVEETSSNTSTILCVAFSYGGRGEIVDAVNKIIKSGEKNITESSFENYLYDPEMPDVDLLIRTSGVSRISNFLLWQLAYAELYFIDKYWPDFNVNDLQEAIADYNSRSRNFGGRQQINKNI